MPVAAPPPPKRPTADPDWASWEAELAERRALDPGRPGPPMPPEPPTDDAGDRPGDDRGRPERIDFTWLKVLAGSFAMMAAISFACTHQGENRRAPLVVPASAAGPTSKGAAAQQEAADPVDSSSAHQLTLMQLPPAPAR